MIALSFNLVILVSISYLLIIARLDREKIEWNYLSYIGLFFLIFHVPYTLVQIIQEVIKLF